MSTLGSLFGGGFGSRGTQTQTQTQQQPFPGLTGNPNTSIFGGGLTGDPTTNVIGNFLGKFGFGG
jgi:hypothetical protein